MSEPYWVDKAIAVWVVVALAALGAVAQDAKLFVRKSVTRRTPRTSGFSCHFPWKFSRSLATPSGSS